MDTVLHNDLNSSPIKKGLLQTMSVLFQKVNFTSPFFAPPVVVLTPKRSYRNVTSQGSGCDAMTAWVEVNITVIIKLNPLSIAKRPLNALKGTFALERDVQLKFSFELAVDMKRRIEI